MAVRIALCAHRDRARRSPTPRYLPPTGNGAHRVSISASTETPQTITEVARRVVVTGGGGFVGQWTVRALLDRGDEVWASGRGMRPSAPRILGPEEWDAVRWTPADITDD